MTNKIPYFILCKQLQAEKNLWEKERVALRRKVEELFAENVRLKKGICKGLDRVAKRFRLWN